MMTLGTVDVIIILVGGQKRRTHPGLESLGDPPLNLRRDLDRNVGFQHLDPAAPASVLSVVEDCGGSPSQEEGGSTVEDDQTPGSQLVAPEEGRGTAVP